MKKNLTLGMPIQTAPTKDSFDTHPAAVEAWIHSLPMSNRGEATRLVYKALHEVNRLEIPLKYRFELLERLGAPLQPLLESLRKHFSVGEYPLSEKATNIAKLATEIQSEVIIGYRIILNAEASGSWLFRRTHKAMWLTSVHRLCYRFADIMENYRRLNMPPPQGIWQEIHRLYAVIEQLGWGKEKVLPYGGEGEPTSIIDEYLRTLLLSLLNYNYMRSTEVETVHQSIGLWIQHCRLKPVKPSAEASFLLRRDQDLPPSVLASRELEEDELTKYLQLDTSRLIETLERSLAQLEGEALTLEDGNRLARNSVEILLQSWTPVAQRRPTRQFRNESVKIIIGITSVNALIRGEAPLQQHSEEEEERDAAIVMKGDEMESVAQFEMMTARDEEADVWNQVYVAKGRKEPEKHWTEVKPVITKGFSELSARVVNFSESGYCLQIMADERTKVRIGDLVALQRTHEEGWVLAAIRWIQQAGDASLLLGVELFASHALPAHLMIEGEIGHSRPIPVIVAIGSDSELALITPYITAIRTKQLLFDYEGYTTGLKLLNRWLFTPSFEVYHFKDMKPKGKVPTAIAALKQLQVTEQAKHAVDDNGDALWIEFE